MVYRCMAHLVHQAVFPNIGVKFCSDLKLGSPSHSGSCILSRSSLHRSPPHSVLLLFVFDNLLGNFLSFTLVSGLSFSWLSEPQNFLPLGNVLSSSSYGFSFFLPEHLSCECCGMLGKRNNVVCVQFAIWNQEAQSLDFISSFC